MPRLLLPIVFAFAVTSLAEQPVEITTPELRGAVQPQLAVTPSGRIHVVFGKDNVVYHTASDDGRVFNAPTKVGQLEKLALKMRRGPRVTATDQAILVTAISHADGNLHAWTSVDRGKTFAEGATINTTPKSATEGLQALAGDGKGKVAAAWMDNRAGQMEVWARFSADGGSTWGEEKKVYAAPTGPVCPCCHPSVAFSRSGEIAITWRNAIAGSRDMYLSTTPDFGRTFTLARKLGEGTWKLEGCPMDGGSVAENPDGHWETAWRRDTKLFAHSLGSPELRFGEGRQPVVGFAGRTRLILWEQNGALMQQRGAQTSRFAETGAGASMVSGNRGAVVAWEAGAGAADGLFVQLVPAQP